MHIVAAIPFLMYQVDGQFELEDVIYFIRMVFSRKRVSIEDLERDSGLRRLFNNAPYVDSLLLARMNG